MAQRRMRTVALVTHDLAGQGGMENAMAELLRHGHHEWRFVVVSTTLSPELRELVEWVRVRVPRRPAALNFISFYAVAPWLVRRLRPDVLHTCGAIVPSRADVATVHFCHAGFRNQGLPRQTTSLPRKINRATLDQLAIWAERWSYRRRTAVLAGVSDGVAHELSEHYPAARVCVAPNGVDATRFAPSQEQRTALRSRLGVGEDEIVVLFVGGDWGHKGLDVVIDALGLLARDGGAPVLWVVGRGESSLFASRASRAGVEATFRAHTPDVSEWYAGADIFVLPSLYETFSLVCYEAAASGLPVIATHVSGVTDLVEDGVSGIFISRSPASVAEAIRSLMCDPDRRASMGHAARVRALEFSWEASYQATAAAYSTALAARERS